MVAGGAAPVMRGIHLYDYVAPQEERGTDEAVNLMTLEGAKVQLLKPGKQSVVLAFGGIYLFDTVEFETRDPAEYEIYAFNGSTYDLIAQGSGDRSEYRVKLGLIEGCYQIKITTKSVFLTGTVFLVYQSKEK